VLTRSRYGLASARAAEGFQRFLDQLPTEPARPPAPRAPAGRVIAARYDNAQTTSENYRLWALSDTLSAKAANSFEVRTRLKARSRYETANSSYLQGIINTKANDLIGTGPTLQVKAAKEVARKVERAFAQWCEAVALTEKLQTQAKAKTADGEGFLFLATYPRLGHSVKLFPRDVEADQVTSPAPALTSREWVDGLVLDEMGNPLAYNLLDAHPGDLFFQNLNPLKYTTVPKRFVLHWFRKDRPGQVRGVPETASTLDLWGEMRRYRKAVVAAAEAAADQALVLKTKTPADATDAAIQAQGDSGDPFQAMPIERGLMTVLPWDTDMGQVHAEQPTTTFDSFQEKMLGECCRGMNVPLNIALGTSQKFNFSSARLDWIGYYAGLRIDRRDCERANLDPLFRAWLDEAVMVDGLLPDGLDIENLEWEWHWPGFPFIDPLTDAKTDTERLTVNRTMTLKRFYAEQGRDWEEELEQLAAEADLIEKLGLPPAGVTKVTVAETDDPATPPGKPPKGKPKNGAPQEEPATAA
jgi:capsid protein